MFLGFKRGVKYYKLWDFKDQKIVLSKDVTFDASSILKIPSSHQMENGQTKKILQRMESDAFLSSLYRFVSFRVPSVVT